MPWRNVALLLNERHLVDFLYAGNALANLAQAALAQRSHTFFPGDALDFRGRAAVDDHFTNAVGQIEQFADRGTAMVASAGALQASDAFYELHAGPGSRIKAGFLQLGVREFLRALAIGTDDADQALGHDAVQSGYEVVRLDAHVDEPPDDVGNVVGVDGGED